VVVALFCCLVLLLTPRRWQPLTFEGEDESGRT
jgi:hypothetical protein